MKATNELRAISALLDSTIEDVKEWEGRGCPVWTGDTINRVGATRTGIKNSIQIMRRMLLQIEKEI